MKKVLAFLLAAVMVFALCACGGPTGGTTAAPKEYSVTTGGDQGTYYGFGGVLAQKITEKTGTKVTAITSGGSKANIRTCRPATPSSALSSPTSWPTATPAPGSLTRP